MLGVPDKEEIFFKSTFFALAGATERNKVLQWLVKEYGKSRVILIQPTAGNLEGITYKEKLSQLSDPKHTVLGIATPHTDTKILLQDTNEYIQGLLQDAYEVDLPMIWIQPSSEKESIKQKIKEDGKPRNVPAQDRIIHSTRTGSDPSPDIVKDGDTFKHTVFFNSKKFVVAIPDSGDQKNAKMVLWWLILHLGKSNITVVPVHPSMIHQTENAFKGISCVKELSELSDPKNTVLALATSPADFRKYLTAAKGVDIPMIWIQSDTVDSSIIKEIEDEDAKMPARDRVIYRSPPNDAPPDIIKSGDAYLKSKQTSFFTSQRFALAGASSKDDQKHGNQALQWLKNHYENSKILPVHRTAPTLEKLTCVKELSKLPHPEETVLGIITKPSDTLELLKKAHDLHIRMIWLQPGAEASDSVRVYIRENDMENRVVYSPVPPEESYKPEKEYLGYSPVTGPVRANCTTPGCGDDVCPDIITNGDEHFKKKEEDKK